MCIDVYHKQSLRNKISYSFITVREQCNVMFKVILTKWHIGMICEIQLLLQLIFDNVKKMISALMFIKE